MAFICTEKSGKLQRKADDSANNFLLIGLYSCAASYWSALYISIKSVSCFIYLFTGFTRAFGRIKLRGSHFLYMLLNSYDNLSERAYGNNVLKICIGFPINVMVKNIPGVGHGGFVISVATEYVLNVFPYIMVNIAMVALSVANVLWGN